jgi:hypothetical protein
MIKKIKRLIALAKKDPEALKVLESLSEEQLKAVPDVSDEGDGKAVFFGEGTHDEFIEQEKADKGLKGWYDRLKNL